jgi:glycosyltransferase involved in cell wall biosynthesis
MRVAIIHDWLVTYAGAEKVLEHLLDIYPDADIFSTIDFLPDSEREFIKNKKVSTTFIQKLPFSKKKYRNYLPFMPLAIEQLDLSSYNLVISSSHAVAKGVITGPDQLHISYIHSPIRYAWDLQFQYLKEANLQKGIKSFITKVILHYIRLWDIRTSNNVDYMIANSRFISKRIKKVYRRNSVVIHPPVNVEAFTLNKDKEDYYLTASRMVPYKKMDLIVEAFSKMPDKKLVVIGSGPDFSKIQSKAGSNIELLGYQSFNNLKKYMQNAKAFVFAAEEDFGITPVEAQACGTPVIAYGKGGVLDTIKGLGESEYPTGVFFYEQTESALIEAVRLFEKNKEKIKPTLCRENSMRFSSDYFKNKFQKFVEEKIEQNGIKW